MIFSNLNIKRNYINKVNNVLNKTELNKTQKALLYNYAQNYLNRRFVAGSIVLDR